MFSVPCAFEFVPSSMSGTPTWSIPPSTVNYDPGITLTALTPIPQTSKVQYRDRFGANPFSAWTDVTLPQVIVPTSVYSPGLVWIIELRYAGLHTATVSTAVAYTWTHT
jgi:hypothetical protein